MINKIIIVLLLMFGSAVLFSQVEMNADSTFTIPYKGVLKAERIYQENNILKAQISKYIQIEEMGDDFILSNHLLHQLELSNSLYKNLEKENYELRLDLREYESTVEKGAAAVDQLEKDLKKEKFRRKVYSVGTLVGIIEGIVIYSILRSN